MLGNVSSHLSNKLPQMGKGLQQLGDFGTKKLINYLQSKNFKLP